MIKLTVESIWKGQVAIRDKYLKEALKEGLQIKYKDKLMTLRAGEIEEKIKGRSEKPFLDRYKKEFHYLIYFDWRPDDADQGKLL